MDLRERLTAAIIKACPNSIAAPSEWEAGFYAETALSIFQDTLDNITDTEELSELQRKIAGLLGEGVSE